MTKHGGEYGTKQYFRNRNRSDGQQAHRRNWNKKNPGTMRQVARDHAKKHPDHVAARKKAQADGKAGKKCARCGKPAAHAHHTSYNPPKVTWLCKEHHDAMHYSRPENREKSVSDLTDLLKSVVAEDAERVAGRQTGSPESNAKYVVGKVMAGGKQNPYHHATSGNTVGDGHPTGKSAGLAISGEARKAIDAMVMSESRVSDGDMRAMQSQLGLTDGQFLIAFHRSIGDEMQRKVDSGLLKSQSGGDVPLALPIRDVVGYTCPHCQEELHEKFGSRYDSETGAHTCSKCGGSFQYKTQAERAADQKAMERMFPSMAKGQPIDSRKVADQKRTFAGLSITIESPAGTLRKWGSNGETLMEYDYGYINGTRGADGDEYDCYLGLDEGAAFAHVVHQKIPGQQDAAGTYDEDKVMLGFTTAAEAKEAYLQHYDDPRFFGSMTQVPIAEFVGRIKGVSDGMYKGPPGYPGRPDKVKLVVPASVNRPDHLGMQTPGHLGTAEHFSFSVEASQAPSGEKSGARYTAPVEKAGPSVTSFGYDRGAAPQADLVVDVRDFPTPGACNFKTTGKHDDCRAAVVARGQDKISSIVSQAKAKNASSIAIGCAAGVHRSVALADSVARRLGGTATHRDL